MGQPLKLAHCLFGFRERGRWFCADLPRNSPGPPPPQLEFVISFTKQYITESWDLGRGGAPRACGLDKAPEILLDALGFEPPSTNALIQRTGFSSPITGLHELFASGARAPVALQVEYGISAVRD
jgi:hypothetical protein